MAADPTRATGFDFNRPTLVSLLHLLGGVSGGAFGISAVLLAYAWAGNARDAVWTMSHYRFHIRTFWYSILFTIVGWLTWWVLGLGLLILALIGIAVVLRSVLALLAAQRHDPVPNPTALIW